MKTIHLHRQKRRFLSTETAAFLCLLLVNSVHVTKSFLYPQSTRYQSTDSAGTQRFSDNQRELKNNHDCAFVRAERSSREDAATQNEQIVALNHMTRRSMIIGSFITAGAILSVGTEAGAQEPTDSSTLLSSISTAASVDWSAILAKAGKKALGGGTAGASASVVQVLSLMWLRTTMNYQYRYGGSLPNALSTLWSEGGIPRFYQGLPFALVQGPLTRFGDTAANVGIIALLESLPQTKELPLPVKTACGSITAGLWRIFLMPVDASKTSLQVEGADGLKRLWESVRESGPAPLYRGALSQAAATTAGHFPWFLTFNFLNEQLPVVSSSDDLLLSLARSAFVGMSASCVSDCVSNSLRVIKTTKQTAQLGKDTTIKQKELSYPEVVHIIIEKDGIIGLFGRGLQTRLLTNAIQGAAFSVLWKYFQQVGS
jgi:hypothetical protein